MNIDEDLARIAAQEERLRFSRFDPGLAWELGLALKQAAERRHARVAIDVSLTAQPLFHCALDGATPDNTEWVRRKRNVTLRFFRSSYAIGLELKRDGRTLAEKYGLSSTDYMAHGGSFPIRLAGPTCIGAITVSGLPQRDDHDLLIRVLANFLGGDEAALALQAG